MDKEMRTKLVELIKNNPELEVIVFAEQDGYESDCYIAEEINHVQLDKYVTNEEEAYRLFSDYDPLPQVEGDICADHISLLESVYPATDRDNTPDSEIIQALNSIIWTEAIVIHCSFR